MTDEPGLLRVSPELSIPLVELEYRATRSGGPGGQHVNTSSTRIELFWNLTTSAVLTDDQRELILRRLPNRIDQEGVLRVVASESRSQYQNRQLATERLRSLVAEALRVQRKRKKTRPPAAAREARLRAKKRRADIKSARSRPRPDD